jgi:glucose/mannose transport system permease protein
MRSLEKIIPKLVIAPGFVLGFAFIYGFMIWNGVLSVTGSRMLPNYDEFVGLEQYVRLWEMDRWWVALKNLGIFSLLYVGGSMALGVAMAIFLDQKVRFEGVLRTV